MTADDMLLTLTPELLSVMRGVAQGQSYAEIGDSLGMSYSTVQRKVCEVMNRLGVQNKVTAVAILAADGVLNKDDLIRSEFDRFYADKQDQIC